MDAEIKIKMKKKTMKKICGKKDWKEGGRRSREMYGGGEEKCTKEE